jgi:hypothetical protein
MTEAPAAPLSLAQAQAIYRLAIDACVGDREGDDWWQQVCSEVEQVLKAASQKEAAAAIASPKRRARAAAPSMGTEQG